ncbi:hypothetical protein RUM43_003919, partial [Polyplax serrata]
MNTWQRTRSITFRKFNRSFEYALGTPAYQVDKSVVRGYFSPASIYRVISHFFLEKLENDNKQTIKENASTKDGSEVLGRFKTNRRQTDDEKERKVESPRAHVKDNEFSAHDVDAPMMKYI